MKEPLLFEGRLSVESIAALRCVLGETISRILTPTLEVRGKFVTASSLSIWREDGFLVLESEWNETNRHVDYWEVTARISQTPKDIKFSIGRGGGGGTMDACSGIVLPHPASQIEKITVHEERWSDEDNMEAIAYDHALVFHRNEGDGFCVCVYPTMEQFLEYTEDADEINQIIKEHTLRFEIC